MARPKAEDPKVALTIRLPKSVADWWADQATQRGEPVRAYIERRLASTAQREPQVKPIPKASWSKEKP